MILTIKVCDFCGKRTDELVGTLRLTQDKAKYQSPVTLWGKRLCKTCTSKFSAMQTTGDKLQDELMMKTDEIYAARKKYPIPEPKELQKIEDIPLIEIQKESKERIIKITEKETNILKEILGSFIEMHKPDADEDDLKEEMSFLENVLNKLGVNGISEEIIEETPEQSRILSDEEIRNAIKIIQEEGTKLSTGACSIGHVYQALGIEKKRDDPHEAQIHKILIEETKKRIIPAKEKPVIEQKPKQKKQYTIKEPEEDTSLTLKVHNFSVICPLRQKDQIIERCANRKNGIFPCDNFISKAVDARGEGSLTCAGKEVMIIGVHE